MNSFLVNFCESLFDLTFKKSFHPNRMLDTSDAYQSALTSSLTTTDEGKDQDVHKYMSFPVALLNLLNLLIGAEILGVANSFTFCGLTVSLSLMVFTAMLSYIGTIIILNLQKRVAAESINDLATKIVGRWGGQLFSGITLFFTYSNQVSYLFIGAETICSWLTLGGLEEWTTGWRRSLVVLCYALILPVALSIPKQMEFIDTASMAAILVQLLFVSSMIYKAVDFFVIQDRPVDPSAETGTIGITFFNAFAIYSTLYALPAVVLPQLQPFTPNMKSRYILLGCAFIGCFTIDIVPSIIGYLMFGAGTEQIVLSSFDHSDILMQVVRSGFFFVVNASFPLVALSILTDLGAIIFNEHNPRQLSWKRRIILLCLADSVPVLIAMILPAVRPIFEIGGAFGGCLSNFFFPPLLYFLQSGKRWFHPKSLALLTFSIFGLLSCGICTYQAVLDAIDAFKGEN
ncbi:Transmembrane amino acid transporter protein [Tritrichomonas foetus]|uniref:Transmembrane amino acid transporter protein n=1 Tax=Tritrichomonas foetus TaxID=1144522 RepID=A0A1J4JJN0_9EUKA|nr:Transmembrane amino acid transporter protein [Tritrichomonas foetus]|eukprot:OHS98817.1 Transmembrane amino acid transporter protein [Tritrichomonas foetus]